MSYAYTWEIIDLIRLPPNLSHSRSCGNDGNCHPGHLESTRTWACYLMGIVVQYGWRTQNWGRLLRSATVFRQCPTSAVWDSLSLLTNWESTTECSQHFPVDVHFVRQLVQAFKTLYRKASLLLLLSISLKDKLRIISKLLWEQFVNRWQKRITLRSFLAYFRKSWYLIILQ